MVLYNIYIFYKEDFIKKGINLIEFLKFKELYVCLNGFFFLMLKWNDVFFDVNSLFNSGFF